RDRSEAGVAELLDPDGQVDGEPEGSSMRYLVPSPDGQLGLLAEFPLGDRPHIQILRRGAAPMASVRWAVGHGSGTDRLTSPTRTLGNARRPVERCINVNGLANGIKTACLVVLRSAAFILIGGAIGGTRGLTIGLIIAVLMNGISYFYSDRIALAS